MKHSENEPQIHINTQTLIEDEGDISLLDDLDLDILRNVPTESNISDDIISFYEDLKNS